MSDPQEVQIRTTSRGGWRRFIVHAAIMLVASWFIYIAAEAVATGRIPTGPRAFGIMAAGATGFYLLPLAISWAALYFNRTAAWIIWVITIGYFTWGILRHAA